MHHHWQDIVLAISILGFNIALIPTIFHKHKPHPSTGILTALFQLSALVVYISLSLWYSAAMSLLNAALWTVLVVQKLNSPKTAKRKR
jgi:K+-sensing histidine kinase KdpD